MLSTIRRALTPSANQVEDKDPSFLSVGISPAAPNLLIRDSSPLSFSLVGASQHGNPPWAAQAINSNYLYMADHLDLPMDLSSDQDLPVHEQEATDDSLIGPAGATYPTIGSHHSTLSLDGASKDHFHIQRTMLCLEIYLCLPRSLCNLPPSLSGPSGPLLRA